MRNDFQALQDGARIVLFPNASNPLHVNPIKATYNSGYFYCDGSKHEEGPDYYMGDVLKFNDGFTEIDSPE